MRPGVRPEIVIVAAVARNGVIGRDNALPWRLPEDLRHFKATTLGKPVIMGRKTWESLGRPLPGRLNLVVSRNADYLAEGGEVVDSIASALARAAAAGAEQACIIGGGELYRQALAIADRLILTEIDRDFEGDATFPPFDRQVFVETDRCPAVSADGLPYAFVTYRRTG